MSEQQDHASKSSSSSISTNTQESEEEASVTIGSLLAQARNNSGHSLGKRLLHLGSIPHTPRVNREIPNFDNATLDHERLSERLGTYGLAEFQIEGDGNCQVLAQAQMNVRLRHCVGRREIKRIERKKVRDQVLKKCRVGLMKKAEELTVMCEAQVCVIICFDYCIPQVEFRALADQIFRNPDYHKQVRKAVMKQLKEFRKRYEGYVPMEYKVYLKKMKRSGEWGDHLTLQAAADRFGAKICLVTSFRDTCLIEIVPRDLTPTREIWLSFWCEVHYNSLYATDDLLTRKTKKKHWWF